MVTIFQEENVFMITMPPEENIFIVMMSQEEQIFMVMTFQEEGLIEKEKRIERESIEAGEEGEMRHTEL